MKKKVVIKLLNSALKSAQLRNVGFNDLSGTAASLPKTENEVSDFIKSRVRIHHHTWIIAPIERALELINK